MNSSTLQPQTDGQTTFDDRRQRSAGSRPDGLPERRQFQDSRDYRNPAAVELADAVDSYKLSHRRRFITYEELHDVITSLGYVKVD
ncbi:MAG: hypothetical protein ACYTGL_27585 [Planctomycetota bacterium]|jgi:hypothetical protein